MLSKGRVADGPWADDAYQGKGPLQHSEGTVVAYDWPLNQCITNSPREFVGSPSSCSATEGRAYDSRKGQAFFSLRLTTTEVEGTNEVMNIQKKNETWTLENLKWIQEIIILINDEFEDRAAAIACKCLARHAK